MWTIITLVITGAALIMFASRWVQDFRHSEGSVWARSLAASQDSAVFLWSYMLGWVSAFLTWLSSVAEYVNLPEVQQFIQYLPPKWVTASVLAIAIINLLARIRTLWTH